MGLVLLTERHAQQIAGVLSCYDRVIVQGTLPVFCYADGMSAYLSKRGIRIFDFTQFAKPLTDAIKANAEALAAANGLAIDYVRKKNFRKEDKIKAVLKERGTHSGLVWIFSALEPCTTYQPWHDKKSGRMTASVCTTTSTSWRKNWACAMCGCRRGARSAYSSIATVTTGWRGSWSESRSAIRCGTTLSRPWQIGRRHRN